MNRSWIAALALATVAGTHQAAAQDGGRFGVTFAVPTALGFIWHATNDVALRPELNFSVSTSTSEPSSGASSATIDDRAWEVAVSAPFYVTDEDHVRVYLSPRIAYARLTSAGNFGGTTTRVGSTQLEYSGSVGAQYAPVRRFNVFGETGVSYGTSRLTGDAVSSTNRLHGWTPRSTVGVILYFGR